MMSSPFQPPTVPQVANRVSPKRARTSSSSSCCSSLVSSWCTDGGDPSSSGSPEAVPSAPLTATPAIHASSTTVVLHRKRRRPNKIALSVQGNIPEVACSVCGEAAVGYNFDAITCDSCKIFFRRNALKENIDLKCINGEENCQINKQTRKKCAACRLKRCLHVGMRREWVKRQASHSKPEAAATREKPAKVRSSIERQAEINLSTDMKSYLHSFNGDFADSIFESYLKQLYNQSEVCVRRLVLALKEMPQFSLVSRSSQVTLMKESIRGIVTLFFCLRHNLRTGRLELTYHSEQGHRQVARFDRQALWKQAFQRLPSSHQLAILQMISMDLKTKLHGTNNMLASDPSALLRDFCRNVMELGQFEHGNDKDLLIAAMCLMRLFQTDISVFSDAALGLEQSRNDSFLIERTHSELKWFIIQYMLRQTSARNEQQEDALLTRVLDHLAVLEKVQAHMELFIQREKVTPLMQEFLVVPYSCDLSDDDGCGGHMKMMEKCAHPLS